MMGVFFVEEAIDLKKHELFKQLTALFENEIISPSYFLEEMNALLNRKDI